MGGKPSRVAPSESVVADTTVNTEHVANPTSAAQVLTMMQTTAHTRLTPTLTKAHPFTLKCLCLHTPQVNIAGADKTPATVK